MHIGDRKVSIHFLCVHSFLTLQILVVLVNDGLELVKSEAKIRIALIMVNYGYFIPSKGCSLHAYTGAVGI